MAKQKKTEKEKSAKATVTKPTAKKEATKPAPKANTAKAKPTAKKETAKPAPKASTVKTKPAAKKETVKPVNQAIAEKTSNTVFIGSINDIVAVQPITNILSFSFSTNILEDICNVAQGLIHKEESVTHTIKQVANTLA
ncbi:hypothetical protein [uncultured Microscilla sp.]|uniref:hypothetical protein n=1 Tax=uncultured Microscilla sp. TaxID=432653 RepID=UPI002624A589|nr:hypothetical protein [uncultured Microscilla sp.]